MRFIFLTRFMEFAASPIAFISHELKQVVIQFLNKLVPSAHYIKSVVAVNWTVVGCQVVHYFCSILQKTVFTDKFSTTFTLEPLAVITKGSAAKGSTQVYSGEKFLVPIVIPSFTPGLTCSLINVEYIVQVNNFATFLLFNNRYMYMLYGTTLV